MIRLSSIFAFVMMLLLGLLLGIWTTVRVLTSSHAPGSLAYGPWTTWPKAGAADADPYSLAVFARRGDIPMAPAEGMAFYAKQDASGATLRSDCDYEVNGVFPQARAWTITVYRVDGALLPGPSGRSAFTSAEVVLEESNVRIALSSKPQPGNWLPLAKGQRFAIVLRFYETPLSAGASVLNASRLPALTRLGCSS